MSGRRVARFIAIAAVLLPSLVAPGEAEAQSGGFVLDRFDPSVRGSDWFALESLDLRGHMRPAAGVVLDWAHRPLVVYNPDGGTRTAIVSEQLFLHAGGALTLFDRLRLSLDLPIAPYQTGDGGVSNGVTFGAPDSPTIGDLRVGGDVRLFGVYGDPVTLAAGARVYVPTGSPSAYTSDGTFRIEPRILASGQLGVFVYAAKVSVQYRPHDITFAGSGLGTDFGFGASAGVKTLDGKLVVGPEIFGSTVLTSDEGAFKTRNTPFEAILGGHYTAGDLRFGLGFGPGLTRGYGSPAFRALASAEWAPAYATPVAAPPPQPPPDRDHDGVPDAVDACPDVAGVATDDPKTNGCPRDTDKDGIVDAEDACPTVPGIKTNDPKTNGCPDRDHDGVPDAVDACPDVPGVATDDPKTNGCPKDTDKDGIVDTEDACPTVPGIKTNDPKTNGCPDPDRDKDGIPNDVDACPDEPGKPDPDPKKNGCPKAYVAQGQIKITEQIKFRFNSSELDPAGDPVMQAVLAVMKAHPEITKVRIEGHTDNIGGAAYNLILSTARANSVMKWLVAHGIDRSRLEAKGFGLTQPLADNKTEAGRRENRRVEFHIEGGAAPPASTP